MAPEDKDKSLAERLRDGIANAADAAEDQKREAEMERLQQKVDALEAKEAKDDSPARPKPNFQTPQASNAAPAKPNAGFQTPQNSNYQESEPAQAAPAQAAPAPTPAPAAQRTYTVVGGDSLSKIAKRFYGDPMQWKRIFEANRDQIDNPDLIHPGQVFVIP